MAVKIRMKRMGTKKKPFYRLVVADSRSPRDGRIIEQVGYYNPMSEEKTLKVDAEKVQKWLSTGAQPTETVKRLLKSEGIITK
ncbi:MAG: 30S ribosomal protein S16 [Clostridiales bacterium]|nr:30S ribosomal protein S16 [Clostridiales bacterium]